jgi:hypothetical protein
MGRASVMQNTVTLPIVPSVPVTSIQWFGWHWRPRRNGRAATSGLGSEQTASSVPSPRRDSPLTMVKTPVRIIRCYPSHVSAFELSRFSSKGLGRHRLQLKVTLSHQYALLCSQTISAGYQVSLRLCRTLKFKLYCESVFQVYFHGRIDQIYPIRKEQSLLRVSFWWGRRRGGNHL